MGSSLKEKATGFGQELKKVPRNAWKYIRWYAEYGLWPMKGMHREDNYGLSYVKDRNGIDDVPLGIRVLEDISSTNAGGHTKRDVKDHKGVLEKPFVLERREEKLTYRAILVEGTNKYVYIRVSDDQIKPGETFYEALKVTGGGFIYRPVIKKSS